jgi:alpha-glucosidase (family GH31 glycosyl hydrolase)
VLPFLSHGHSPHLPPQDWHEEPKDKTCESWGNYDVNTDLFPDMVDFAESLHAHGAVVGNPLKLSFNVHPQTGVDHCDSRYPAFARAVGVDPSLNATIPCDFGNATFIDALYGIYFDQTPLHLVDIWWTDYGGCGGPSPQLWNNRVVYDHQKFGREVRGQAFSRYGGTGNHRYPHGFSGDTFQHEVSLYWQVKTTQTAANVLWGYWSHDIGGFHNGKGAPGDADPTNTTGAELLLRWIQWGAVAPILRTHCDHCERRIWLFPYFDEMRDAMRLRNALGPTIYTAARAFYDSGVALVHPLYYDFGADAAVFAPAVVEREFMFCDQVLAAPITTMTGVANGSLAWPVYLPAGTWATWNGTKTFTGPVATAETYGPGDIPLFVRGGGLLALKTMASVAAHADPVVWAAWPGAAAGAFEIYEDDGDSDAYQGGEFMTTAASYVATAATFTLTVAPANVSGALFPGALAARGHVLQLRGVGARAVASVTVNGAAVPPAAPGVVPGFCVVAEADHTLAAPAGALVVSAGAGFDVFSPTVIAVTFS